MISAALLLISALLPTFAAAPDQRAESVLLITLDTTRADKLGCYGSKAGLTPSLDAFSKSCYLFEHCQAPVPQTVPSHVSIMSGWDPPRHGVRKNLEVQVSKDVPLLAQEFKEAGYSTGAFVSSFVLLGQYGMGRGFEEYEDSFYDRRRPQVVERAAEETLSAAREWLKQRRGGWFCWVHLYDPHAPYAAPEPYASRHKKASYDGEIAYMDWAIGEFISELKKAGTLDKTAVVICGDHGEGLGEHGEETHSVYIYDSTTRVPLLLHLPGQTAGRKVSGDVSLTDIAPTLRGLCRLKPQDGDGFSLEGHFKDGATVGRPPVYIESLEGLYSFGWAPLYGLVEKRVKFILAPRGELYELDSDPGETKNISATRTAAVKRLKAELSKRIKPSSGPKQAPLALDDEEMKSLQSLGYLAGTPGTGGAGYKDPKDGVAILALHERAVDQLQRGDRAKAAKSFESIVAKDPNNSLAYFYAANCIEKTDPAKAISYYRKAILKRKDFPQAFIRLMGMLEDGGRNAEAYQLSLVAIKEVKDYTGELRALAAWAAFGAGRPEAEVLKRLEEAKRIGPERGISHKLRAILALRRGDRETAILEVQRMASCSTAAMVKELGRDARFKEIKDDPRFWKVVIQADKESGGS